MSQGGGVVPPASQDNDAAPSEQHPPDNILARFPLCASFLRTFFVCFPVLIMLFRDSDTWVVNHTGFEMWLDLCAPMLLYAVPEIKYIDILYLLLIQVVCVCIVFKDTMDIMDCFRVVVFLAVVFCVLLRKFDWSTPLIIVDVLILGVLSLVAVFMAGFPCEVIMILFVVLRTVIFDKTGGQVERFAHVSKTKDSQEHVRTTLRVDDNLTPQKAKTHANHAKIQTVIFTVAENLARLSDFRFHNITILALPVAGSVVTMINMYVPGLDVYTKLGIIMIMGSAYKSLMSVFGYISLWKKDDMIEIKFSIKMPLLFLFHVSVLSVTVLAMWTILEQSSKKGVNIDATQCRNSENPDKTVSEESHDEHYGISCGANMALHFVLDVLHGVVVDSVQQVEQNTCNVTRGAFCRDLWEK